MGLEKRDGYWLWVDGPVAPGAAATTIGSVILIRGRYVGDARLLRHELQHVRQYRQYGLLGFFRWYLSAYVKGRLGAYPHWAAYRRIPFEIEAEWRARRMAIAGRADDANREGEGDDVDERGGASVGRADADRSGARGNTRDMPPVTL